MSLRKFTIGLVVLGTLLVLYMGYAQIGGTDRVDLRVPEALPVPTMETIEESNDPQGQLGDMSIGTIRQTQFVHLDEAGRPDYAFGFDVFLHQQGDWWRCTQPYLKQFWPTVQCHVTADMGDVQIRTAFGKLVAKDALFQGNVVIHIIPPEPGDPRECFIYLDDVTFVADKSLFSSTGPVRFVSRSAMLQGTGMEMIYDRAQNRLELFRIVDLDSVRIRSADIELYTRDKKSETPSSRAETASLPADRGAAAVEGPPADKEAPAGSRYECVFYRNVTIDAPDRLVVARDSIAIKNIFRPEEDEEKEEEEEKGVSTERSAEPNVAEPGLVSGGDALDTKPSTQLAFDAMPMESFDIVVTCDGGCVIAPAGASALLAESNETAASTHQSADQAPPSQRTDLAAASPATAGRERVIVRSIEYDASTGDAALVEPQEIALWLDPNNLGGGRTGGPPVPMTITARKAVRFLAASTQVFVEGDCTATVEQTDPNLTQTFTLSAPAFVLDLEKNANASLSKTPFALKRFTTSGGPASIVVHKQAEGQPPDWMRMRTAQLEYEAGRELFTASGPGEMWFHNARPATDPNAFGLDQPGYARLWGFDRFVFAYDTNRLAVTSGSSPILFAYVPFVAGKAGQEVSGDAGRLDVLLRSLPGGRMGLASLVASGGVTYEEKGRRFAGTELTYDHEQSRVRVTGDETRPCSFNGALVPEIEMDLKTNSVKTEFQGTSTFQGRR